MIRRRYLGRTEEEVYAAYKTEARVMRDKGYKGYVRYDRQPWPFWLLMPACILSIPLLGVPLLLLVLLYRRGWIAIATYTKR